MPADGTRRDSMTGLWMSSAEQNGLRAFAAAVSPEEAEGKARARLESAKCRISCFPPVRFPGLGFGKTDAEALAAAWQEVFLSAVRVKLRRLGIVPPDAPDGIGEEIARLYRSADIPVCVKDCSMLKGYPVLGMEVRGVLYTGTGVTASEAMLNCAEYEILSRTGGPDTGCTVDWEQSPSCPPRNPFHRSAEEALQSYLAMAERYGAHPRAMRLHGEEIRVFQILLEQYDPRMLDERTLVFEG